MKEASPDVRAALIIGCSVLAGGAHAATAVLILGSFRSTRDLLLVVFAGAFVGLVLSPALVAGAFNKKNPARALGIILIPTWLATVATSFGWVRSPFVPVACYLILCLVCALSLPTAARGRSTRGQCGRCGYDRRGLPAPNSPCPECGRMPDA